MQSLINCSSGGSPLPHAAVIRVLYGLQFFRIHLLQHRLLSTFCRYFQKTCFCVGSPWAAALLGASPPAAAQGSPQAAVRISAPPWVLHGLQGYNLLRCGLLHGRSTSFSHPAVHRAISHAFFLLHTCISHTAVQPLLSFPTGATVVAEWLSCALWWVSWTRTTVSSTGQPHPLIEATPAAPLCRTYTPNTLKCCNKRLKSRLKLNIFLNSIYFYGCLLISSVLG